MKYVLFCVIRDENFFRLALDSLERLIFLKRDEKILRLALSKMTSRFY